MTITITVTIAVTATIAVTVTVSVTLTGTVNIQVDTRGRPGRAAYSLQAKSLRSVLRFQVGHGPRQQTGNGGPTRCRPKEEMKLEMQRSFTDHPLSRKVLYT